MQSKVSMVISCYNKAGYVDATLQSVYNQVWDNIELILINNGSTDGSLEILREWEPKLKKRGYEVVLISHENIGLPAAIHGGILRITGNYFCTIDADDEIYPEYVSTMAGWLDDHPEYEWVSCDYEIIKNRFDGCPEIIPSTDSVAPDMAPRTENLLLNYFPRYVWRYLVRTRYLTRCIVLDSFKTPSISHEPQLLIPLFAGDGQMKSIPKVLYKYNIGIGISHRDTFEKIEHYESVSLELTEAAINRLNSSAPKNRWLFFARLRHAKDLLDYSETYLKNTTRQLELAENAIALINKNFTPAPDIPIEKIFSAKSNVFFRAVEDCIFGNRKTPPQKFSRVVGYGALGKVAKVRIPQLIGTVIQPDVLWDNSAECNSEACGIAVRKPDFDALTPEDLILIFPKNEAVVNEFRLLLGNKAVSAILSYTDILEILPILHFPQFYNGCKFIGE